MKINCGEKTLLTMLLVAVATLSIQSVYGDSCGVMKLQENKSTAITIKNNSCGSNDNLAIGAVITMRPGSRLWLKSNPEALSESRFQLICQNLSQVVVDTSVYGMFPPWFKVSSSEKCSGWIDNKLNCTTSPGSRNNFFCALAYERYRRGQEETFARSSSVKIRSIDNLNPTQETVVDKRQFDHYLDEIKRDIALCKQVNRISETMKFVWQIKFSGGQQRVTILSPRNRQGTFFDCAEAVLASYPYSLHHENLTFEAQF